MMEETKEKQKREREREREREMEETHREKEEEAMKTRGYQKLGILAYGKGLCSLFVCLSVSQSVSQSN